MEFHSIVFSCITLVLIIGILKRPWNIAPWIWACSCAVAFLLCGVVTMSQALRGILESGDVAAFLIGMMLFAEFARRRKVFDWLASQAVFRARGSTMLLLSLVYGVGIIITAFLSNDATAVVLTPAVAAVVKKAKVDPWPHVLACALIANAASFLLPIANPANLVVYGATPPTIIVWLQTFLPAAIAAIVTTYLVIIVCERKPLAGNYVVAEDVQILDPAGRHALLGLVFAAIVLIIAMQMRFSLGLATLGAAFVTIGFSVLPDIQECSRIARDISWDVILFVAGLFMFLEACQAVALVPVVVAFLHHAQSLAHIQGLALISVTTTILCSLMNNLPVGLLARSAISQDSAHMSQLYRNALMVVIDVGPNLAVTSSLATLLWMDALKRENITVDAWRFLRIGIIVTPLSLAAALAFVR